SLDIALIDPTVANTTPRVFATGAADGAASYLLSWAPFSPSTDLVETSLAAGQGPLGGAPAVLDNWIVAPGTQADASGAAWNPNLHLASSAQLQIGIVTSTSFTTGDYVLLDKSGTAETAPISNLVVSQSGRNLYALDSATRELGTGVPIPKLFAIRNKSM